MSPDPVRRSALDQVLLRGDLFCEAAFFDRETRTLILTDLIENFEAARVRGAWARRPLAWARVVDQDGRRPLDMGLAFLFRGKTLRAAGLQFLVWNPERVILAHGRWFESEGASALRRLFAWALCE